MFELTELIAHQFVHMLQVRDLFTSSRWWTTNREVACRAGLGEGYWSPIVFRCIDFECNFQRDKFSSQEYVIGNHDQMHVILLT